jgi:hypothetical protein
MTSYFGKLKGWLLMRSLITKLTLLVYVLTGLLLATCDGQVLLTWNPNPNPAVAGYYLCWGVSSHVYTLTNTCKANQTSVTISTLALNTVYFFAVQAYASNGMVSPYSNEVSITNQSPSTNTTPVFVASTNNPPAPGGASPVVSGNGGTGTVITSTGSNYTSSFWGVPPFLMMTMSDGIPNLYIAGTVGATLVIETRSNLFSSDRWEEMTNVTLTNIALLAQSNQAAQGQTALDVAYVPAEQVVPIAAGNLAPFQILRVVMPYDYIILGGIGLQNQGYTPRLIIINMPGIVSDDACYINQDGSFIHYDAASANLQLENSGPSIRQIATTLASSLELNWTSASEFIYSNGVSQILATVVQTEPPSLDPVPEKTRSRKAVVIDF